MVCGQPDPKMNENKSRDNEKQTEENKDSPVMVQTFLLYFQKLYFSAPFICNKFWETIGKKAGSV